MARTALARAAIRARSWKRCCRCASSREKKRDQPTLALILAIDRSGSMSGRKLELAKDAARATAEMLGPMI